MHGKKLALAAMIVAALCGSAGAVSVSQLARDCGDDSKVYCKGVGYGDAMTRCLTDNYKKLRPECRVLVDRVNNGEKVTLF